LTTPTPDARGAAFWLAHRGAQQLDLAQRFARESEFQGLRVLALKGISIADELYEGAHERPMADIDFLVVDTARFAAAAGLARSLGLIETGTSDHALAFVEPLSGVVLELHVALTSCPGLFSIRHEVLWDRRKRGPGNGLPRLSDGDFLVHLALHIAFQHGFAVRTWHADDFVRALEQFSWDLPELLARAREWKALSTLAVVARVSSRRYPASLRLREVAAATAGWCAADLARWTDTFSQSSPPFSAWDLARVRWHLAPSKLRFLKKTVFPQALAGSERPRTGVVRRLSRVAAALSSSHLNAQESRPR